MKHLPFSNWGAEQVAGRGPASRPPMSGLLEKSCQPPFPRAPATPGCSPGPGMELPMDGSPTLSFLVRGAEGTGGDDPSVLQHENCGSVYQSVLSLELVPGRNRRVRPSSGSASGPLSFHLAAFGSTCCMPSHLSCSLPSLFAELWGGSHAIQDPSRAP